MCLSSMSSVRVVTRLAVWCDVSVAPLTYIFSESPWCLDYQLSFISQSHHVSHKDSRHLFKITNFPAVPFCSDDSCLSLSWFSLMIFVYCMSELGFPRIKAFQKCYYYYVVVSLMLSYMDVDVMIWWWCGGMLLTSWYVVVDMLLTWCVLQEVVWGWRWFETRPHWPSAMLSAVTQAPIVSHWPMTLVRTVSHHRSLLKVGQQYIVTAVVMSLI